MTIVNGSSEPQAYWRTGLLVACDSHAGHRGTCDGAVGPGECDEV